jgi:hypothetical protein
MVSGIRRPMEISCGLTAKAEKKQAWRFIFQIIVNI